MFKNYMLLLLHSFYLSALTRVWFSTDDATLSAGTCSPSSHVLKGHV